MPIKRAFLAFAFVTGLVACLAPLQASAEPFPIEDLPPDLDSWVPWVLDDAPDHFCPAVDGEAICLWPGELMLVLDGSGGRFSLYVTTDRDLSFSLPGDLAHWPQDVTLDGRPVVVLNSDGSPQIRVQRGTWKVDGRLVWNEMPEGIHIPITIGLVSLEVESKPIQFPRRDEDGLLWLQSALNEEAEGDRMDLEVYRKLSDNVPLTVVTKIVLRASGKSREVDLGPVLLANTTIMSVTSDIPARIDKEGHLRIQVRAGTHDVELTARSNGSPTEFTSTPREEPWPAEEIWVWQGDEVLRQVSTSGPPGIDPSRTNLPKEWSSLPAFLMHPGGKLLIKTTRKGEPDPPPDQISLSREIWMDLDGSGFTVRDNLSGELNSTWRLDLEAPEGELGHVSVDGEDQLITVNPGTKKPGVELRSGSLNMTAEWMISGSTQKLPAVGWTQSVQDLAATLNLPPGWTLITARGVDDLPGTWWDEWDLFSFFFVLLVSLGIGKLTRWFYGIVALGTLVLIHLEAELGFVVFISLSLLLFLGLLKVLPRGKLHLAMRICWWITVGILVLALVPFSVTQARKGLYPQIDDEGGYNDFDFNNIPAMPLAMGGMADETISLEESGARIDDTEEDKGIGDAITGEFEQAEFERAKESKKKAPSKPMAQRYVQAKVDSIDGLLDIASSPSGSSVNMRTGKAGKFWRKSLQQDPKAVVQTGPGVPVWSWRSWQLSWSGPVDKGHEVDLFLLSPRANMILSFLRIILLVFLSLVIIREAVRTIAGKNDDNPGKPTPKKIAKKAIAATTGAILVLASLLAPASVSGAEQPSQQVLDDLREKITRVADCNPDCVSTSLLEVELQGDVLTLDADVHVGTPSSWRIPGPAGNWVPKDVIVDGRRSTAMALLDDGFLHLRLDRGRHRVRVSGPAPPGDAVTLEFGETPHRVVAQAPGWTIDGLREDGRVEASIQLSRLQQSTVQGGAASEVDEHSYPPWLEVTRTLDIGIPWLVHTEVRRVSPTGSPVMARIPLLTGESVTESDLQVEENGVVLSMGRDDTTVVWSSTLEEQKRIDLVAPSDSPWSEIWVLSCSPAWQCDFNGLNPIRHKSSGVLEPTFKPWPGDKLVINMVRPDGVKGQSITVDSARLHVYPGIRLLKATLNMVIRSSQGGVQVITLPKKASIQKLSVNGEDRHFRQKGKKLEVTLKPGSQSIHLEWQQPGGISSVHTVPKVDLGGPAANAKVVVELPGDRWLLWAGGPSWGPAILFWGFLLTILLGGLILGRLSLSPLKDWQWMLLVLGLTQIPVPVALIIVGWFFILAWRKKKPPHHFFWHNSLQIVIGMWTLGALVCLFAAVYSGLAVQPDMQVSGASSSDTELIWYVDRIDGSMPQPWVLSLPDLAWKVLMLLWSLWLAWSLVKWSRWGWKAFSRGRLWLPIPKTPTPASSAPASAKPEVQQENSEKKDE